jgi:hypothetical protein
MNTKAALTESPTTRGADDLDFSGIGGKKQRLVLEIHNLIKLGIKAR